MTMIDQRIEDYRQKIAEETNPVLKRLYEASLSLLLDLKAACMATENEEGDG